MVQIKPGNNSNAHKKAVKPVTTNFIQKKSTQQLKLAAKGTKLKTPVKPQQPALIQHSGVDHGSTVKNEYLKTSEKKISFANNSLRKSNSVISIQTSGAKSFSQYSEKKSKIQMDYYNTSNNAKRFE
jgi:hypothetical protein